MSTREQFGERLQSGDLVRILTDPYRWRRATIVSASLASATVRIPRQGIVCVVQRDSIRFLRSAKDATVANLPFVHLQLAFGKDMMGRLKMA